MHAEIHHVQICLVASRHDVTEADPSVYSERIRRKSEGAALGHICHRTLTRPVTVEGGRYGMPRASFVPRQLGPTIRTLFPGELITALSRVVARQSRRKRLPRRNAPRQHCWITSGTRRANGDQTTSGVSKDETSGKHGRPWRDSYFD